MMNSEEKLNVYIDALRASALNGAVLPGRLLQKAAAPKYVEPATGWGDVPAELRDGSNTPYPKVGDPSGPEAFDPEAPWGPSPATIDPKPAVVVDNPVPPGRSYQAVPKKNEDWVPAPAPDTKPEEAPAEKAKAVSTAKPKPKTQPKPKAAPAATEETGGQQQQTAANPSFWDDTAGWFDQYMGKGYGQYGQYGMYGALGGSALGLLLEAMSGKKNKSYVGSALSNALLGALLAGTGRALYTAPGPATSTPA